MNHNSPLNLFHILPNHLFHFSNILELDLEKKYICIELSIKYSPIIIKKFFLSTPIIYRKLISDLCSPSYSPKILYPRRKSSLTSSMEYYEFMDNLPIITKTILPEKLSILLLQFIQLVKIGCPYGNGDNSFLSLKNANLFFEKYIQKNYSIPIEMELLVKIFTYSLFRIFGHSLNLSILIDHIIPMISQEIDFAGSFQPIHNLKMIVFRMGESLIRLYFDISSNIPSNDQYYQIYDHVFVKEKNNSFEFFSNISS